LVIYYLEGVCYMNLDGLKKMWEQFIIKGDLDERVQPTIAKSWKRCRQYGVDPWSGRGKHIEGNDFKRILIQHQSLLDIAIPIMQSVYEIVKKSHFLLVLTDEQGTILKTIGDNSIQKRSQELVFSEGTSWNTLEVGSNAIGIALDNNMPIQIRGAEHYCVPHHNWTCSAAPIHGLDGRSIGVLDISGNAEEAHPHTLALAVAGAFSIENMMSSVHNSLLMRTALNSSHESIILLNDNFFPIWLNLTAKQTLSLFLPKIAAVDFRKLLPDLDWKTVADWNHKEPLFMTDVRFLTKQSAVHCSVSISSTMSSSGRTYTIALQKQEKLIQSVNKMSGNRAKYTFDDIYTQDPVMQQVITLAQKYAQCDGNILIEGESGTGKELFAQSIHNNSQRSRGPFVAINCASLPRDLIESELFGYEKGAFTGALKEGNPGKFELANHGTLFLDEIGEMPLEFQAKLLRAVETLCIRRIGGKEEKRLDVRIIAATNRNLHREVELGHFRDDLYFRLNVLPLCIPPLRERPSDISFCAKQFFERLNRRYPYKRKNVAASFFEILKKYSWPGNIRELQNSIERVFYICSSNCISQKDFSYIIDETQRSIEEQESSLSQEREKIIYVLQTGRGSIEAAANSLGVSRATFYRMCKQYKIMPKMIRKQNKCML